MKNVLSVRKRFCLTGILFFVDANVRTISAENVFYVQLDGII